MANFDEYKTKYVTAEQMAKTITEVHDYEHEKLKPHLSDITKSVNKAQQLLNATKESEDGTDVKPTDYWATSEDRQALQQAIETANGVISSGTEDQGEIESAKQTIDDAIDQFEQKRKLGTYETPESLSELRSKVAEAQQDLSSVTVSKDGSDVTADNKWVTSDEQSAFNSAIESANSVLQKENPKEQEITEALSALASAKETFDSAKKDGTKTTEQAKQELDSAVEDAQSTLSGATRSADGTDVEPPAQWVDEETYDALQQAITDAQALNENSSAEDVADAKRKLDEAKQAFEKAKKPGTKAPADAKEKLQTKTGEAESLLSSATKSTDGSDVSSDQKWVNDSTYDALQQAITKAQGLTSQDSPDAGEVQSAQSELESAMSAFEAAKKDGLKASETTKSEHSSKVNEAQGLLDSVVSSADGSDVTADKEWVDTEKYQELSDAIDEANTLKSKSDASEEELNASKQRLESAIQNVNDNKAAGTKVTDAHKAEMTEKLSEAQTLLGTATASEDGSDVTPENYWVEQDVYDNLKNAIDALTTLSQSDNASDAAVQSALSTLESASTAFRDGKKPGTKSGFQPGTDLPSISWDDLSSWADDIVANPKKYSELIGQTKDVELVGLGSHKIRIAGIAHDDLSDGSGKAPITWEFADIIEEHRMNSSNTTSGGWEATEMRSQEMEKIYNALPAELKAKVVKVKKKTYNKITVASNPQTTVATGSELTTTDDYVWLFSASEVGKKTNYSSSSGAKDGENDYPIVSGEGDIYDVYSKNDTLANHIKQHQGANDWWWLRSISVTSASGAGAYFRAVTSNGLVDSGTSASYTSGGVAPGFCTK